MRGAIFGIIGFAWLIATPAAAADAGRGPDLSIAGKANGADVDPQWSVRFLHWQDSPPGLTTVDPDGDVKRFAFAIRAPNGVFVGASADITTPPYVGRPRDGRDTARAEGQVGYEWAQHDIDFGAYVHAGYLNGRAMEWMNSLVLGMHRMDGQNGMRVSPWSTKDEKVLAAASGRATKQVLSTATAYGPLALDLSVHAKAGVDLRQIGADVTLSLGSDRAFVPDVIGLPIAAPAKKIVPYVGAGVAYTDFDITTKFQGTRHERASATAGVRADFWSAGVTVHTSPTTIYHAIPNPLFHVGLSAAF